MNTARQYETRNKRQYQSYEERLRELLNRRSHALHKATSVPHTLLPAEREHRVAYYEGYAEHVRKEILGLLLAQHPDKRPVPPATLDVDGRRMVIQRHDGVNTWYVPEDKFNPDLYEYLRSDYAAHIEAEFARH